MNLYINVINVDGFYAQLAKKDVLIVKIVVKVNPAAMVICRE
jgi:hypothetical protein